MNKVGILQAKHALKAAETALEELRLAIPNDVDLDLVIEKKIASWQHFLVHTSRIYNKLSASSRDSIAKGWFDREMHLRKQDDLLSYLLHARNALEHGIDINELVKVFSEPLKIKVKITGQENPLQLNFGRPVWLLAKPVKDRGVVYEVPKFHMDKSLEQSTLQYLAEMALPHFERLVSEAENHVD